MGHYTEVIFHWKKIVSIVKLQFGTLDLDIRPSTKKNLALILPNPFEKFLVFGSVGIFWGFCENLIL